MHGLSGVRHTVGVDARSRGPIPTSLEPFLDWWYGPVELTQALTPDLPPPLAQWQRQAAARKVPISVQNRVVLDVAPQPLFDLRPVYIESQAVWLWGVDPARPEGVVFERENVDDATWSPTGEDLAAFLWHAAVFEAVLAAPAQASLNSAPASVLHSVTGELQPVPTKQWLWPGPHHRLWYSADMLVFSCANTRPGTAQSEDDDYAIFAGSLTAEGLAGVESAGLPFDYDSRPGS